ncbi:DUF3108 domain-containing protein [Salegentibacter mishustinae]|uniref:DUF3108 domain-containing protein n=1 Tax=Salegentibacter mishustinae TaxID=270918 RepID=UPI001CE06406|nr:DUF3108 domain-containing protein [Salegentibacter mishustinae]UBZ08298.1 DUF3108 domain-containing protein [Salegentibacter mishustinae]
MKKSIFTIFLFLLTVFALQAQSQKAFSAGEWFKFRIHYGPFNASYATLEVDETNMQGEPVYHIKGRGKSTGLLHWFFKVDDNYQTYIDKQNGKPYKFIRKIDEGGYTKDLEIDFDHSENKAYVFDRKHNENHTYTTKPNVHDMLSAFYYIRNNIKNDELRPGDEMRLNLFIDDENMDFKLKFLGREVIKTKFGKVATLKFRPYVMAGRVFKEKESLTFWVSDDANRIPLKIEANLAVGSLDADLDSYKGLKHPFKIIMN